MKPFAGTWESIQTLLEKSRRNKSICIVINYVDIVVLEVEIFMRRHPQLFFTGRIVLLVSDEIFGCGCDLVDYADPVKLIRWCALDDCKESLLELSWISANC